MRSLVGVVADALSNMLDRVQPPVSVAADTAAAPWQWRVRVWPAPYDWAREGDL